MTTESQGQTPVTEPQGPPTEPAATEPTTPEGQPPEQTPAQAPAELRAHAERQEANARKFRDQLLEERLQSMGLDKSVGVGKAIFQSYEGDDLTATAVGEYAKSEWGHEAPQTPAQQAATAAQQIAGLDANAQQTTPSQTPDEQAQIESQMMDPDKAGGDRVLVESSIKSKWSKFFASNE